MLKKSLLAVLLAAFVAGPVFAKKKNKAVKKEEVKQEEVKKEEAPAAPAVEEKKTEEPAKK